MGMVFGKINALLMLGDMFLTFKKKILFPKSSCDLPLKINFTNSFNMNQCMIIFHFYMTGSIFIVVENQL